MIKFAIKSAFRKRNIAMLAIVGIAIGIALMVILNSASIGLSQEIDQSYKKSLGVVLVRQGGRPLEFQSFLSENITTVIQNSPDADKIDIVSPEY